MAWTIIQKPGTEAGPCRGDCGHSDCEGLRILVGQNCPLCKQPIGYDKKITITDDGWTHFACVLAREEL